MKRIGLVFVLSVFFSSFIYAQEEFPEAPPVILEGIIKNCRSYAEEDQIPAQELKKYLLKCVNDDLSDLEYKTVDKSTLEEEQQAELTPSA